MWDYKGGAAYVDMKVWAYGRSDDAYRLGDDETAPEEEVKLDAVTVLEAIVDIQEEVTNNSLTLESLKNKEEK